MSISGILAIIGDEALRLITASVMKKLKRDAISLNKQDFKKILDDFPELYENHFREICKWASSIPFIGLAKPKKTKESTIELIIASEIVRSDKQRMIDLVSEDEVINSEENIILIGLPGAGKTTTIKRLILTYLQNISKYEETGFPILIKLRDVSNETTLFKYLLDIFSIPYEEKTTIKKIKKTIKVPIKSKSKTKFKEQKYKEIVEFEEVQIVETFVGDLLIQNYMVKFLNQTNCFLILDGLDEIDKSIQIQTLRDIEKLGLKLNGSKILLTIRRSELNKILDGFVSMEIAELNVDQIREIAGKWVIDSNLFLNTLESKPYRELANRPIYLTFLLILFEKNKTLPTQPSEIYEDITTLIIKEWDEHRDIKRQSKYIEFNTRTKFKFLSEISYYLTYRIKQKVFSKKELEEIYMQIHDKYNLPADEMSEVVEEIESHTGLIVEASNRNVEFSHLSLQEFLCAKHLKDLPFSRETIQYFLEYPEPLAVAICICGEPSLWFSNLILNSNLNITNFSSQKDQYFNSMYTLLNRLLIEAPKFKVYDELGAAFIYLISNLFRNQEFQPILSDWFKYKGVQESISSFIKGCEIINSYQGYYLIRKRIPTDSKYFMVFPNSINLPDFMINELTERRLISIVNNKIE